MPSPDKYKGSVVRQLSLQNPTPLQSPTSRELKKQLSVDDSRVLEAVEVTGQGWNIGTERGRPSAGSGNGKMNQAKIIGTRPKPVKLAWADKKPENSESSAGVEVIATKCQGQPRPTSLKTQRLRSPLLGNKDTLVYTRLQLAERLRNAWSEREKIKPNINIFLSRAPDTTRSENDEPASDRPPSAGTFQDSASALSDSSAPLDKKRKSMRVRAFRHEFSTSDNYEAKDRESLAAEPTPARSNRNESNSPMTGEGLAREENEFVAPEHPLQELSKIEIRMTKIHRAAEDRENKPPEDSEEASAGIKRCRNKISESFSNGKLEMESKPAEPKIITAEDRRASFRRNSIMHKTITESFSSGIKENENKMMTKPSVKKPPLIRAFSAPSQNEQPPDAEKAANLQKKVRTIPQKRLQPTISFDVPSTNADDLTALRERMKSAPVRRRLKSAAARRKNKDRDSSDEEKEIKDSAMSNKKASRRSQLKKGGDIVTMVSLVSPAESDTEDSVINLPMESWRGDEKEEAPQSGKACSGSTKESKDSASAVQKFMSLRKTQKSVTFHPHPILNRSYSASFPSRRAPAGTPIVVPTPVISNPALTPAQLLERDKRAAIFPGIDGRGIKRKLFRSSSEVNKDDDSLDFDSKGSANGNGFTETLNNGKEPDSGDADCKNDEPNFKCPKERECWNLYQKMIEKGVSVSFDTVLRGMLTPTEYRLRKNQNINV